MIDDQGLASVQGAVGTRTKGQESPRIESTGVYSVYSVYGVLERRGEGGGLKREEKEKVRGAIECLNWELGTRK